MYYHFSDIRDDVIMSVTNNLIRNKLKQSIINYYLLSFVTFVCVCVCVCEREREGGGERERERERG
jgi:hypothetical protein